MFVYIFIYLYVIKTLERYLSEPGIVEGSGFRHFVGNCVLQITYISDFVKKAKRSELTLSE